MQAALIGLGTMGPGIAAVLSRGGIAVKAYDAAEAARERARSQLDLAYGVLDRLGTVAPEGGTAPVTICDDLASAVEGADLVIENVPEKIEIKAEVYRAIDPLIGPDVIVATDTSGIPISTLQGFVSNPERFVGMHWSNPPHLIPMIEVIAGGQTAPATVEFIVGLIRTLKLLPVVVKKDVPGFVENRVLYALLREVVALVEDGVIDPADIDTCVSWGIGYKLGIVGPMALLDMAGLDTYENVSSFLNRELSTRGDVSPFVSERTGKGKLGLKSGGGVYDYTPDGIKALQTERAAKFVAVRRALEGRAK
ncbi:MAG TPA: 5-formyl-3-hydroxy-2-methylpyridine 4-carboxylate 5-dehydrogenase [Lichenihabitans sp.]|jgi:3-hydroxybutyryl-CoA dehydrogenase/5-formyl-3-hydroxy-2-methylpyridine 4-carboxylate dehydrogenase|nr:5-formyl-3-hydroxy-2-methylpyridine 4-carboxylate 5-dehydrogenase [Lichenihabitans sp.]